jgi:hypothetical protein
VREDDTRLTLYGARMDIFFMEDIDQRIAAIYEYLSSMACCPLFHDVARVKLAR